MFIPESKSRIGDLVERIIASPSDDNLPPEHGPPDEEEPLISVQEPEPQSAVLCGSAMLMVLIGLLITTVAFAALYYQLLSKDSLRLPKWPKPSLSPMGKYSRAAVAADNEICSEIGRTTQECTVIDAREIAPNASTEDMYEGRWNESRIGWRAVAVPGELHGLWTEYEKFGSKKLSWNSLVQPTIELLDEGFPTSHALAKALAYQAEYIAGEPTMKEFLNPKTGKVYRSGEQIKTRTSLLRTLRHLANSSDPLHEFYKGDMASEMAREFQRFGYSLLNTGGIITEADFAAYRSIVIPHSEVIYTKLRNNRVVCGPPPPSGSAVAQAILNVMDGYQYNMKSFGDIARLYHHFIESSKFAYAARSWLGDPAFISNATEIARNITSPEWAEWIRSMITEVAQPDSYYGGTFEAPPEDHGTTHISVIDTHGNAVSVTSTINLYLGASVVSPSTGILWNDEMDDFSTPHHPNYFGFPPSPANFIQPGKRPMSSQSPLIIFDSTPGKKSAEILAVGGAGGSTIISGVAGVAFHGLWLKANVKQAVDAPRLHNQLYPNTTCYEPNFPRAYLDELEQRGHVLKKVNNLTVVTAVERARDGQLYANSDFRKGEESAPAGY
ncbi:unnamed protein product [Nippostrongylus brasiliensis]|uniref:Gamma-glutamyltranspeptidase n=1 Tax=Nippostrongylus brasiliensis TaxID=27835 RepID=A0A0N4XWD4_NIPBR|nr:unnamed protein product [Nippostrongylus brasiliensis]